MIGVFGFKMRPLIFLTAMQLDIVKERLHDLLQRDCNAIDLLREIAPQYTPAIVAALQQIGNPRKSLELMRGCIESITVDANYAARTDVC